jgi:hypothetical protein
VTARAIIDRKGERGFTHEELVQVGLLVCHNQSRAWENLRYCGRAGSTGKVTNSLEKGAKKIMARDVHWELVCSEKSRPFAIETFRLKVPNGWLYCNTITRARALTRDEFSQSMVFVPDQVGAD